jgi:hypothetical protein
VQFAAIILGGLLGHVVYISKCDLDRKSHLPIGSSSSVSLHCGCENNIETLVCRDSSECLGGIINPGSDFS